MLVKCELFITDLELATAFHDDYYSRLVARLIRL